MVKNLKRANFLGVLKVKDTFNCIYEKGNDLILRLNRQYLKFNKYYDY